MICVAVCDDEKKICDYMEQRTRDALSESDVDGSVTVFSDGDALLEVYKSGSAGFDLIFLDIKMTRSNGVSVAKDIRAYDENVLIVFVTSSAEYVFSGYEVKAFRYILKTELQQAFSRVFKECLKELLYDEKKYITFQSAGGAVSLPLRDVLYFESDRRKVNVCLKTDKLDFYRKLDEVEKELRDRDFVRCHQSYLVNAKEIRALMGNELTLTDGTVLPISKSRLSDTKDAYLWAQR